MAVVVPSYPDVPPSVELEPQAKKRLLAGIKTVLTRLKERGAIKGAVDYAEMLGKPQLLHAFITAYKANRDIASDIVLDSFGQPVGSDTAPLSCGLSLAQVCQMLVYTCAKRIFVDAEVEPKPQPSAKLAGLFRRKEQTASAVKSEGERKLAELKPFLAFDWQLPLLKYYYFFLDRHQLAELGRDLLLLREPEQLEIVSSFEASKLKAARRLARADFPKVLLQSPASIVGLAHASDLQFALFQEACGPRVYAFFARDLDYIDDVSAMDRPFLRAVGPLLADTSGESLNALSRLPAERVAQLLEGFRTVFRADTGDILGDPGFGRGILLPFVQRFVDLEWEANQFIHVVELKCTALQPTLEAWLDRRRAGLPAELPDTRP